MIGSCSFYVKTYKIQGNHKKVGTNVWNSKLERDQLLHKIATIIAIGADIVNATRLNPALGAKHKDSI